MKDLLDLTSNPFVLSLLIAASVNMFVNAVLLLLLMHLGHSLQVLFLLHFII